MNGEDLNERWEGRGVCDSRQSREKQLWLTVLSLGCPSESPESLKKKKKKRQPEARLPVSLVWGTAWVPGGFQRSQVVLRCRRVFEMPLHHAATRLGMV